MCLEVTPAELFISLAGYSDSFSNQFIELIAWNVAISWRRAQMSYSEITSPG